MDRIRYITPWGQSRCTFQLFRAMREPFDRGTGNKNRLHVLCICPNHSHNHLPRSQADCKFVMNGNSYAKVLYLLCFVAFAAVSCWATSESFHLLLPSWPMFLCYVVTIGFFVIASFGTKMIVDSLDQDNFQEKRGLNLFGGIIILLVFWLICSFPTNTHTFFYRNIITSTVTGDISDTQALLAQIRDNVVTEQKIQDRCSKISNDVMIKFGELEAEIKNEANPGHGPKSKSILSELASLLGVAKIEPLSNKGGKSVQALNQLADAYRQKILILLDSRLKAVRAEMTPPNDNYRKIAKTHYDNLTMVTKYINDGTLNLNDAKDVKEICAQLDNGYNTISSYRQYVQFKNETQEQRYTANNPVNNVKGLLSVFDVWQDFFAGKYEGHGFLFWIIISLLVDVAAFIFFTKAFKKQI